MRRYNNLKQIVIYTSTDKKSGLVIQFKKKILLRQIVKMISMLQKNFVKQK